MPPFTSLTGETVSSCHCRQTYSSKVSFADDSTSSITEEDAHSVSFSMEDQRIEYEYECDSSYSPWFSKTDIKSFKSECSRTIAHGMKGSMYDSSSDMCMRGLEAMSKAGSIQYKSRRQHSRFVVFEEQNRQRGGGFVDHEKIAKEYKRATAKSVAIAVALGLAD